MSLTPSQKYIYIWSFKWGPKKHQRKDHFQTNSMCTLAAGCESIQMYKFPLFCHLPAVWSWASGGLSYASAYGIYFKELLWDGPPHQIISIWSFAQYEAHGSSLHVLIIRFVDLQQFIGSPWGLNDCPWEKVSMHTDLSVMTTSLIKKQRFGFLFCFVLVLVLSQVLFTL